MVAKQTAAKKAVGTKAVAKKSTPAKRSPAKKTVTKKAAARSAAVRDSSGRPRLYTVGPDIDLDHEEVLDSRGRRITNEYADSSAADALAKVGRGRPSLSGDQGSGSPQVTFRLSSKLREKVERRAAAEGKKISQLAREALESYLG